MMSGLNKYIGIAYEKMDCWQFICHYYETALGIALPSFEGQYKNGDDKQQIARIYSREMARDTWPRVDKPDWPDLVVFRIGGKVWHAGVVVGNQHMLHIQRGCNSVIEKFTNYRWKNRLYGFYRFKG